MELRYETIVVEDGKLHIYRDVYDQETNTEEKLRSVLEANGVRLDDLTEAERTQVMEALAQMSSRSGGDAARSKATPAAEPSRSVTRQERKSHTEKTATVGKNQKEIVIEIGALKGKGYPAPVALDTGSGKTKAGLSPPPKREKQ